MKWFYNRIYRKDKGFTLVELMVVIIILAVLTGIAIPSYLALRNRARVQATRSEMQNIANALEMYAADFDAYPAGAWNAAAGLIENEGYMDPVPLNDAWEHPLVYAIVGTGYTLTSLGADNAAATADDIILTDGQLN